MKKMLILIAIFIFLVSGVPHKEFSLLDYFEGDYVCYSETENNQSLNLGACYMTKENVSNKIGESLTVQNFEPSSALKELNAKVIKTEVLDSGAVVIYAYCSQIPRTIELFNSKVNLQIAYYDTHSVIGWPLILGSF